MAKSILIVFFFLSLFAVGCSSNLQSNQSLLGQSSGDNTQGVDSDATPDVINQAPKLSCSLKNTATNQIRSVNSIDGADTFFADSPRENEALALDCSGSSDNESQNSDLKFYISTNYSGVSSAFTQISELDSLNLSSLGVGRHHLAIKIVDAEGNETVKDFRLTVRCEDPSKPVLDISGVSVTAGARLNLFNYSIDPSKVANTGGEPFSVAIDFNGDGAFDPKDPSALNDIWGAPGEYSFNDVYTVFATENTPTRTIGIRLRNACQEEAAFEVPVKFEMPNIPRNPNSLAVPKPYYYLQADIVGDSHDNTFMEQRVNAEYLATWYPDDKTKRVECDYKVNNGLATFTISGYHKYKTYDYTRHGMSLKLENIPDSKQNGVTIVRTNADGVTMTSNNYKTSAIDDAVSEQTFSKVGGCQQRISITHAIAVTPCATGPAAESDTVTILGEFSCPSLRSNNDEVEARNGKFYCEVSVSNQCVGGGGGGGGGNPPPEQ